MDNKAHNAQVEAYLKDYLNDESFAQFAVLLTGKWGSGKTHFILNLKDQYDAQSPHEKNITKTEINWVYVSLNGIDSIDEVEKRIFMAAHAWLNNTAVKLGKSFLGSLVASPQIYGVGFDTKNFMRDLKKLLPKVKNAAFIFDDVERCRLPLSNLFGYINNFVEHDKLKVIIVTDEDKLKAYFEKEKNNQHDYRGFSTYEQVKEKLIGQTLEIKPYIEGALEAFINDLKGNPVKDLILKNKTEIIDIFKQSEKNNLRSLKTAFFNFERLHNYLNDIAIESKNEPDIYADQLANLLLKILAITLEYKGGKITHPSRIFIKMQAITPDVLAKYLDGDFDISVFNDDFTPEGRTRPKPISYFTFLEWRYRSLDWYQTPIDYAIVGLFIEKGILPNITLIISSLYQDYKQRKSSQEEHESISNLWIRLFRWQFANPKKLDENLKPFMEALENHRFIKMGDILQAVSQISLLIEYNRNPLPNGQSLEDYFDKYLHQLNSQNAPADFSEIHDARLGAYKNYGYNLPEDSSLFIKIKQNTIERAIKTLTTRTDLIDFISDNNFNVLMEPTYLSFPLMNHINVNDW